MGAHPEIDSSEPANELDERIVVVARVRDPIVDIDLARLRLARLRCAELLVRSSEPGVDVGRREQAVVTDPDEPAGQDVL